MHFTIEGEPCSKANSRTLVTDRLTGRPRFIKSPAALGFEATALLQIPVACRVMYPGPVRVTLHLFYRTERPDLDESIVLDVLQTRHTEGGARRGQIARRGVIVNDRQVREKHVFHGVDERRPRCEVLVESLL